MKTSRSFVKRGSAWYPTAQPPTTRYSALVAANAESRSLKSGWRSILPANDPRFDDGVPHRLKLRSGLRVHPELEPHFLELLERSRSATGPGRTTLGGARFSVGEGHAESVAPQ